MSPGYSVQNATNAVPPSARTTSWCEPRRRSTTSTVSGVAPAPDSSYQVSTVSCWTSVASVSFISCSYTNLVGVGSALSSFFILLAISSSSVILVILTVSLYEASTVSCWRSVSFFFFLYSNLFGPFFLFHTSLLFITFYLASRYFSKLYINSFIIIIIIIFLPLFQFIWCRHIISGSFIFFYYLYPLTYNN